MTRLWNAMSASCLHGIIVVVPPDLILGALILVCGVAGYRRPQGIAHSNGCPRGACLLTIRQRAALSAPVLQASQHYGDAIFAPKSADTEPFAPMPMPYDNRRTSVMNTWQTESQAHHAMACLGRDYREWAICERGSGGIRFPSCRMPKLLGRYARFANAAAREDGTDDAMPVSATMLRALFLGPDTRTANGVTSVPHEEHRPDVALDLLLEIRQIVSEEKMVA